MTCLAGKGDSCCWQQAFMNGEGEECRAPPRPSRPRGPCLASTSFLPPPRRTTTMISHLCSSVTVRHLTRVSTEPTDRLRRSNRGNRTSRRRGCSQQQRAARAGRERRRDRKEGRKGTASHSQKGREEGEGGRKGGNSTYHIRPATAADALLCYAMLCPTTTTMG